MAEAEYWRFTVAPIGCAGLPKEKYIGKSLANQTVCRAGARGWARVVRTGTRAETELLLRPGLAVPGPSPSTARAY